MTPTEFQNSLSTQQTSALNALLVEQRDALTDVHTEALSAALLRATTAEKELAGNIAYQKETLARFDAAMAKGDLSGLPAIREFAGAEFGEKERLAKLEKAAELRAEAAKLEADASK